MCIFEEQSQKLMHVKFYFATSILQLQVAQVTRIMFISGGCKPLSLLHRMVIKSTSSFPFRVWVVLSFVGHSVSSSVIPDQTPRSMASDLGLHCLSIWHIEDARLVWMYAKLSHTHSIT